MNWLDFKGRRFKVKVTTRSDVKNFGTPYLYVLNGLMDFDQILHKYSIPWLDESIAFWRL